MHTTTQINTQPQQKAQPVAVKGAEKAKKEPSKMIEKVIDTVEEFLVKPANKSTEPPAPQQERLQQSPATPEQPQQQGSLGGSIEYVLPEGTTIKLPDGKEFETHTESKITKK